MEKEMEKLYEKYPWLRITTTVEEYIDPEYYDKLLNLYIFLGKTDLQFFEEYLKITPNKMNLKAVELGCGSGRVTNIFLNCLKGKNFHLELVDLSSRMLKFCQNKFREQKNLTFIKSDLIEFLEKTKGVYNVIFSLWSFSHSVHQILIKMGVNNGKKYIQNIIKKVVEKNMVKSSTFFLIHFDSLSDEQKILMQQWKKVYPIYNDTEIQSPSKLLIDEILQSLQKQDIITLKSNHYEGEEITYSSPEEALEIFLNFHMESYFNENLILIEVIDELLDYFKKFTDKKGIIKIRPGCFIYKITKK